MKRFLIVLTVLFAMSFSAEAQLLNFGFRGGVGPAFHVDEMSSSGPRLGANVGAFLSFGFTGGQSFFAEHFWLQTGVNIIRRGTQFEEAYEKGMFMSIRNGRYSAIYAQLPLLATFRYELPIREPGHIVMLSIGPAVSYGITGTYRDRKVSRGLPQESWNYDVSGNVFDKLNRLDANILFGLGYEWKDLSFMVHIDYGFMAVSQSPDVLKNSEADRANAAAEAAAAAAAAAAAQGITVPGMDALTSTTSSGATVPGGNNMSILFTVGYQIPIR